MAIAIGCRRTTVPYPHQVASLISLCNQPSLRQPRNLRLIDLYGCGLANTVRRRRAEPIDLRTSNQEHIPVAEQGASSWEFAIYHASHDDHQDSYPQRSAIRIPKKPSTPVAGPTVRGTGPFDN